MQGQPRNRRGDRHRAPMQPQSPYYPQNTMEEAWKENAQRLQRQDFSSPPSYAYQSPRDAGNERPSYHQPVYAAPTPVSSHTEPPVARRRYAPPPNHGGKQNNNNRKNEPKHASIGMIFLAVVLVAVLGVGVWYALQAKQLNDFVARYDNRYNEGVFVNGIHLGGMTQQEAAEAVSKQVQQATDAWTATLMYQGQELTTINASHLGMRADINDALRQAWAQGHMGNAAQRRADMEQLLQTPYEGYTATPSGDTSVIDALLNSIKAQVNRAPVDARVDTFNPAATDPFTFQADQPGMQLDIEPLKEQLYRMVSTMESGTVNIEPTMIPAQVTLADVKKTVTLLSVSTTPISTRSTTERTNNIRRAFEKISGQVVRAGGRFSFNDVVGERTLKNGFYEAIEYAYGESVMGVGGGVCQASSTLYTAAVAAGMRIDKRDQHSASVNYTDFGYDATVYWVGKRKIDLAFTNTSDSDIYIVARVESDPKNRKNLISKVMFYGQDMGNVRYELYAETTQILSPPSEPQYVKDKNAEYVTYTDEEKEVSKAKEGYVIDSYRIKYVDGQEVERTHMYTDHYDPKPAKVYVGVTERW